MRKNCRVLGVILLCCVTLQILYYAVVTYGQYPNKATGEYFKTNTSFTTNPTRKNSTHKIKFRLKLPLRKNLTVRNIARNGRIESQPKLPSATNFKEYRHEVDHIVFLKVHKAASTTIQTTMLRYGYAKNLSFVLPVNGHYLSNSTRGHRKLLPPRNGNHYDILCIHCFFNHSVISAIMPKDSVYIAIVRDPMSQFISAFKYYREVFKFKYLVQLPSENAIDLLINYPEMYEPSVLSYTMNSMARDFGFHPEHYNHYKTGSNFSSAHAYLRTLDDIFDIVLIADRLDESLILLKRLLNWRTKDILYRPKNVQDPDTTISKDNLEIFRERNKLDYLLYDHFLEKYMHNVQTGGVSLKLETSSFKKILVKVQYWCDSPHGDHMIIEETIWNEEFIIEDQLCELLDMNELRFLSLLKDPDMKTFVKK